MKKFFFNTRHRKAVLSRLKYKEDYHQLSSYTELNRSPELFEIVASELSVESPKILSFGCSSGEEVEGYLKMNDRATVVGVDINEYVLGLAQERVVTSRARFLHSLSSEFKKEGVFDVISACAVFQDAKNRTRFRNDISVYPFEKFSAAIKQLDEKLKKGGLFVIDNSDFQFLDAFPDGVYEPIKVENNEVFRDRPLFGKDNKKLSDTHQYPRVFRKLK